MHADNPKRPYNPKDQGSNWEGIRVNPKTLRRILAAIKARKGTK